MTSRPAAARTTIGVLIFPATEEDLAEWLPIAQGYVDSFVFEAPQHRP